MNLSYECLKKMANDPEFAKEIEYNLSGEVQANAGNSGVSKTQNKSDSTEERIRKKREEKEEMEARLDEKRRKKEEFEERLEEMRQERKAYLERFIDENSNLKQNQSAEMTQTKSYFDTNA